MHNDRAISGLVLLSAASLACPVTQADSPEEPEWQADVYNELYEAHAHCDDELNQSRSEFIVGMFERNRGNRVSIELLRKLLLHNVQIAKDELTEAQKARNRYVSERMNELETATKDEARINDRFRKRLEQLKLIDEKISTKERYIEVYSCVLSILQ